MLPFYKGPTYMINTNASLSNTFINHLGKRYIVDIPRRTKWQIIMSFELHSGKNVVFHAKSGKLRGDIRKSGNKLNISSFRRLFCT